MVKASMVALFMSMSYKIILRLIPKQETSKKYLTKEEMQTALNITCENIDKAIDECFQSVEETRRHINTLRQNFIQTQVGSMSREQIKEPMILKDGQGEIIHPKTQEHSKQMQTIQLNINSLQESADLLLKDLKTPSIYRDLGTPFSDCSRRSSVTFSMEGGSRKSIDLTDLDEL